MTIIKTKNSVTASGVPADGSLSRGELAVNIADKKLWVGDASSNPVSLAFEGTIQKAKSSTDDSLLQLASTNTTDGTFIDFKTNTSSVIGRIGISTDNYASLFISSGNSGTTGGGLRFESVFGTISVKPCDGTGLNKDNSIDLGSSAVRFDDIYATNGTIQTSDRNEKQDIAELSGAETRVAVAAKGLLRKFKWRDAVASKGADARTHFGIIAQDLQDAFTAEGLDASDYAMFISTTWWEHNGEQYLVQSDAPEGAIEKTRLGVRYLELLAFIIASI